MNVRKANCLCNGNYTFPDNKDDIRQSLIFESQLAKHVLSDECRVSILNSFPIFIYEYREDLPVGLR